MVLISKPRTNRMLDPLKVPKYLTNSDSLDTLDSHQLNISNNVLQDRKSFIYPPDLKTATKMIEEGKEA